jgi:hypothetical protein
MIISAGMSMNEAGLVPPISELIIREPRATPIPMAVEAFIAAYIGCREKSFNAEVRRAQTVDSPYTRCPFGTTTSRLAAGPIVVGC